MQENGGPEMDPLLVLFPPVIRPADFPLPASQTISSI